MPYYSGISIAIFQVLYFALLLLYLELICNVLFMAAYLRAPKWYKRPVGVSFGFGGKLVSFHPKSSVAGASPGVSEVCFSCSVLGHLL